MPYYNTRVVPRYVQNTFGSVSFNLRVRSLFAEINRATVANKSGWIIQNAARISAGITKGDNEYIIETHI